MTLTLKSRSPVRFEITDDEVETTVTLLPEDDEATLVRKMRRIINLVGAEQAPAAVVLKDTGYGFIPEAPPAQGNGWAAIAAPELPEDRKGEWEIIPPEEQG